MSFVHKSVNPFAQIGADLRELRQRTGCSLEQAAHQTKITKSFLEALEEERWEDVGDAIYAERILRAYVHFLGGKEKYFLEKYHEALKARRVERDPSAFIPRPRHIRRFDLTVTSRLLTIVGFAIFSLVLGGYIFFQVRIISTPPKLVVTQPIEGEQEKEPRVAVRGTTLADAIVNVNGKQTVVQADGSFAISIDIPRGTTLITISAKKRHSRETTVTRRVLYDQPLPDFEDATSSATTTAQ